MIYDEFLSTGEASRVLNISRSTVSRGFDQGTLQGKKNPITGERLISRESIIAFMKQYDLPLDASIIGKKRIMIGSSEEKFISFVQKALSSDQRLHVETVNFGGDVLIQQAKEKPDLLIVDDDLSDIPGADVIKSLRRGEQPSESKILYGMKSQKMKQGADPGADESFAKDGAERIEFMQKVYRLLDIPEELPKETLSFQHLRQWPRLAVNLPAEVGVYSLRSPLKREPGKGVMGNISMGGAYLSQMHMDQTKLPGEPFRLLLQVSRSPLENMRVHCKVIRLQSNGSLSVGLQFVKLSKTTRSAIESIYRGAGVAGVAER